MTENQPDPGLLRLTRRVARQLNCSRSTPPQLIENSHSNLQTPLVHTPPPQPPPPPPCPWPRQTPAALPPGSPPPRAGPQASALLHAASPLAEDASGTRVLRRLFLHLACLTPLPTEASGLVVYTQDRRLARVFAQDFAQDMALRQPAQQTHSPEQECIVQVAGTIAPDGLQRLRQGLL